MKHLRAVLPLSSAQFPLFFFFFLHKNTLKLKPISLQPVSSTPKLTHSNMNPSNNATIQLLYYKNETPVSYQHYKDTLPACLPLPLSPCLARISRCRGPPLLEDRLKPSQLFRRGSGSDAFVFRHHHVVLRAVGALHDCLETSPGDAGQYGRGDAG